MRKLLLSVAWLKKITGYAIVLAVVVVCAVFHSRGGITANEIVPVWKPNDADAVAVSLSSLAIDRLKTEQTPQRNSQLQTPESSKIIPILLLTYLRSGSSWLGAITSQPKSAFYVYEPFKGLIKHGYYSGENVCFNNGICRKPKTVNETLQFALTSLRKIYSCHFDNLDGIIKRNLRMHGGNMSLSALQKSCLSASHRIVKTIRMSLDDVAVLLREMPNMKVVLLVRDPRGIVNSRVRGRHLRYSTELEANVLNLCTRMSSDVTEVERLMAQYRDRVTMVMYDAMAEDPVSAARFIYNFTDLPFTPSVEDWVISLSHATGNISKRYYGTQRSDSSKTASSWRHKMPFGHVHVIDEICSSLYARLGFLPIPNERAMKDHREKTRKPVERPGFL